MNADSFGTIALSKKDSCAKFTDFNTIIVHHVKNVMKLGIPMNHEHNSR